MPVIQEEILVEKDHEETKEEGAQEYVQTWEQERENIQVSISLPITTVNLDIPITKCVVTDHENTNCRMSRGLIVSTMSTLEIGSP